MRFHGEFSPIRSELLYTGNMYSVLSTVLEKTFGKPWEDLLIENLFEPLGMDRSTFFNYADPDYEGFVTPYNVNMTAEDPEEMYPSPLEMYS